MKNHLSGLFNQLPRIPNFTWLNVDVVFGFLINLSVVGVSGIVLYLFILEPYPIDGPSMEPTLFTSEYVLVEKLSLLVNPLGVGDIVVFNDPKNFSQKLVKRVIGVAGDTILVKDNRVYVNNELLAEKYLSSGEKTVGAVFLRENRPYHVPEKSIVVMGDHRTASTDSRFWGAISQDQVVGRVVFRIWPFARFGLVR